MYKKKFEQEIEQPVVHTAVQCKHLVNVKQEAQLSPSDRAMRLVSSNLADYHATLQKLYDKSGPN